MPKGPLDLPKKRKKPSKPPTLAETTINLQAVPQEASPAVHSGPQPVTNTTKKINRNKQSQQPAPTTYMTDVPVHLRDYCGPHHISARLCPDLFDAVCDAVLKEARKRHNNRTRRYDKTEWAIEAQIALLEKLGYPVPPSPNQT